MNSRSLIITAIVIIAFVIGGFILYNMTKSSSTESEHSEMTEHETTSSPTTQQLPSTNSAVTTTTEGVKVVTVTVNGSNFKFEPSEITVNKGDRVKVIFNNTGGTHDFVIDAPYNVRTKIIQGGASDSFEFTADQTGTFEYYCSVGNHRAMGMKGNLVVN